MINFDWKYPWSIHIGSHTFIMHALFEFLAFFVGFRYYLFLRKKQGDVIHSDNRLWIIIGAIFGAVVGSRLVGGFESITQLNASSNKWVHFYANKTVVGGFLGGLFGVEGVKIWIGEKNSSGDLFVYPMLLALLIGRVGCVGMGIHEDVFGMPTQAFVGMDLGDGIYRHPLMLYEMFFLICFWFSLYRISHRYQLQNGVRFKLFMIGYLIFRFGIEYLKIRETYLVGMGAIQIACLTGLVYYGKTITDILLHGFKNLEIKNALM